jgi:hypothetical protein
MDLAEIIVTYEDLVFDQYECDAVEIAMIYFIIRVTILKGIETTTIPLSTIAKHLLLSETKTRDVIRLIAKKGLISLEQTKNGHSFSLISIEKLNIIQRENTTSDKDIENLDFYEGRKFVQQIVERENGKCFYCLRNISIDSCELDHVISKLNYGDNSYRNIVACCHSCNTKKQGIDPKDHLRKLLRDEQISEKEFEGRLQILEALQKGELIPVL